MFALSSDAMLTKLETTMSHAEATSIVSVVPCPHSFDEKLRTGYALAGRYAR